TFVTPPVGSITRQCASGRDDTRLPVRRQGAACRGDWTLGVACCPWINALRMELAAMTSRSRVPAMLGGLGIAALLMLAIGATPAAADNPFDMRTNFFHQPLDIQTIWIPTKWSYAYVLNNTGFTLEPGEPTEGGVLTRSAWARFTPLQDMRVVLHTFGSEVDTVLAVYTGSAVNALTRVVGNNDIPAPGLSSHGSLVQFDATAGVPYSIQVGSIGGQQGVISLNVLQAPVGGGLSAFLALVEGSPVNNKDYVCETTTCFAPTFLVHNSGNQPVDLVSSTTFGALFNAPAPTVLAPGAAMLLTFSANANTSFTTQTLTGQFVFSGRVGGAETSRTEYPGLVLVRGTSSSTSIQAAVLPGTRAGRPNQVLTAFGTVINS